MELIYILLAIILVVIVCILIILLIIYRLIKTHQDKIYTRKLKQFTNGNNAVPLTNETFVKEFPVETVKEKTQKRTTVEERFQTIQGQKKASPKVPEKIEKDKLKDPQFEVSETKFKVVHKSSEPEKGSEQEYNRIEWR